MIIYIYMIILDLLFFKNSCLFCSFGLPKMVLFMVLFRKRVVYFCCVSKRQNHVFWQQKGFGGDSGRWLLCVCFWFLYVCVCFFNVILFASSLLLLTDRSSASSCTVCWWSLLFCLAFLSQVFCLINIWKILDIRFQTSCERVAFKMLMKHEDVLLLGLKKWNFMFVRRIKWTLKCF